MSLLDEVLYVLASREGQGWIVLALCIGVLAGVISRVYLGW